MEVKNKFELKSNNMVILNDIQKMLNDKIVFSKMDDGDLKTKIDSSVEILEFAKGAFKSPSFQEDLEIDLKNMIKSIDSESNMGMKFISNIEILFTKKFENITSLISDLQDVVKDFKEIESSKSLEGDLSNSDMS